MKTLLLLALLCQMASAANFERFAGIYEQSLTMENLSGKEVNYSTVVFKMKTSGAITGYAILEKTGQRTKVTGKLTKVVKPHPYAGIASGSGTFSDGTKWTTKVTSSYTSHAKVADTHFQKGGFRGWIVFAGF